MRANPQNTKAITYTAYRKRIKIVIIIIAEKKEIVGRECVKNIYNIMENRRKGNVRCILFGGPARWVAFCSLYQP